MIAKVKRNYYNDLVQDNKNNSKLSCTMLTVMSY